MIESIEKKHGKIVRWRKSEYWRRELKSLMRNLGRASNSGGKNKEERVKSVAVSYVQKSLLLSEKITKSLPFLPVSDIIDY
jgi:hypothetical protein